MLKTIKEISSRIWWEELFDKILIWLSVKLASLALRLYPENKKALKFFSQYLTDLAFNGQAGIKIERIDPNDLKTKCDYRKAEMDLDAEVK